MPGDSGPPVRTWPWIALMWWFLGLVAYHLLLEHRAHAMGAVPYVLVIATVALVYVWSRRVRKQLPSSSPPPR